MKKLLSILLLLSCYLAIFSQGKTEKQKLVEFVGKINSFNHLYPQEKVYLHFDNTAYYLGETIWFKAYVVVAEDNRLSELSKVLYVELLTPEGKIMETQKLKIENGQASGGLTLKERYFPGFYQVRAYTRCMLNFGEEIIFSRVFPIYNRTDNVDGISFEDVFKRINIKPRNLRKEKKNKDINLAFYPEGGNLVAGIANRVAFKATDKNGKAIDITGRISNSSGNIVTTFTSLHLGMGSFILYSDGNKQTAKVSYKGKEYKFDLPESKLSGYAMQIENLHPETVSVQVEKTANQPEQMLGITFACRGKVYAFETFEPDPTGQYTLRLSKENLPSGVVQITLFTSQGEVLAQRQVFINNNIRVIPVKITNIQASFEPLSPISIDFEIKDTNNHPVETTFSLSVKDEITTEKTNYTDNILYNLLLSSELKGYIENPAYYFEADDNQHRLALDLLMMVQGWIRYSWKQAAGMEAFEVKHVIEKSLMIDGRILSTYKRNPQEDIEITMWMSSGEGWSQQGKCITDKQGKFNFGLEDFTNSLKLNFRARKKNKNGKYSPLDSRITLDRNFSPVPLAFDYYQTHITEAIKTGKNDIAISDKLIETDIEMEEIVSSESTLNKNQEKDWMSYALPEVTVKGDISPIIAMQEDPKIMVYNIAREMDKYLDEGESLPGKMMDFLASIDPYYSYFWVPNHTLPSKYMGEIGDEEHKIVSTYNGRPVSFYIWHTTKGISGPEGHRRNFSAWKVNTEDVEYISIAANQTKGAEIPINIHLNESGKARLFTKGMRETYFDGFAPVMEFYSPDYSIASLPEPDVRRTLYWNPDVKTDNQGRASVHFYNNETCKKLSISAEGLSIDNVPVIYKESSD